MPSDADQRRCQKLTVPMPAAFSGLTMLREPVLENRMAAAPSYLFDVSRKTLVRTQPLTV